MPLKIVTLSQNGKSIAIANTAVFMPADSIPNEKGMKSRHIFVQNMNKLCSILTAKAGDQYLVTGDLPTLAKPAYIKADLWKLLPPESGDNFQPTTKAYCHFMVSDAFGFPQETDEQEKLLIAFGITRIKAGGGFSSRYIDTVTGTIAMPGDDVFIVKSQQYPTAFNHYLVNDPFLKTYLERHTKTAIS